MYTGALIIELSIKWLDCALLGSPGDVLAQYAHRGDRDCCGRLVCCSRNSPSAEGLPIDGRLAQQTYNGAAAAACESAERNLDDGLFQQHHRRRMSQQPGHNCCWALRVIIGEPGFEPAAFGMRGRSGRCGSTRAWRLGNVRVSNLNWWLFGVDFILDGEQVWTVGEPRYTASVEWWNGRV
jgi:hypothetical protein